MYKRQVGDRAAAERRAIEVDEVRWMADGDPPPRAAVQVRHRGRPVAAAVERLPGDRARLVLDHPLVAAPGQAAVLYDGDTVIGGGWISSRAPALP